MLHYSRKSTHSGRSVSARVGPGPNTTVFTQARGGDAVCGPLVSVSLLGLGRGAQVCSPLWTGGCDLPEGSDESRLHQQTSRNQTCDGKLAKRICSACHQKEHLNCCLLKEQNRKNWRRPCSGRVPLHLEPTQHPSPAGAGHVPESGATQHRAPSDPHRNGQGRRQPRDTRVRAPTSLPFHFSSGLVAPGPQSLSPRAAP